MKANKLIFFVLMLMVEVACARRGNTPAPKAVSSQPKTLQQLVKPSDAEKAIKQKLDLEIEAASKAGCDFKDRFANCQTTEIGFAPAAPKPSSAGQRILVLDETFITPALVTRHRDRVLELGVQNNDGTYRRAQPKFRITQLSKKLNDILRSASAPVRNEALGDAAETMAALNAFAVKNVSHESTGTNHGEVVFETLAKLNPQAQFMIAPFPVISEDLYCRLGDRDAEQDMRRIYINAAHSLIPAIREFQITHANISWAVTDAKVRGNFKAICGRYPDEDEMDGLNALVLAQASFVRELAKQTNIFIAQAAPNDYSGDFNPRDTGAAWSCLPNSNIISVGYLGFVNSGLKPQGNAIDRRWIPYQQASSSACTDIFVNGGIHEVRASRADSEYSSGYGVWWNEYSFVENYLSFTSSPARSLSNSWLTPVALSMIIHMEQEMVRSGKPRPSASEMARKVKGRMFDPLANKQTELQNLL